MDRLKKPFLWGRAFAFSRHLETFCELAPTDHTFTTEVHRRYCLRSSNTWKSFEKYSVIFGNRRKSSEVFGRSSEVLGRSSEVLGRSSEIFGRFRVVFGSPRKVSHDLRRSSKYIGWPPAVFILTLDIFAVIYTRVSLFFFFCT